MSNVEATTDYNIAPSSWVSVRGILSSSIDATINVTGASGNLDYNLDTEELQNPIDIWTVKYGKLHIKLECRDCQEAEDGCSEQLIKCVEQ